jgi:hypothetical protein
MKQTDTNRQIQTDRQTDTDQDVSQTIKDERTRAHGPKTLEYQLLSARVCACCVCMYVACVRAHSCVRARVRVRARARV